MIAQCIFRLFRKNSTSEQLEEMIPPPYTEIEQQHIQVIKTVMNSLIDQNEKLSIAWTQWCEKLDKNSLAEQLFLSDQHSYGNICEQFYDHMVTEYKMKIEVLVNSCSSSLQQISVYLCRPSVDSLDELH